MSGFVSPAEDAMADTASAHTATTALMRHLPPWRRDQAGQDRSGSHTVYTMRTGLNRAAHGQRTGTPTGRHEFAGSLGRALAANAKNAANVIRTSTNAPNSTLNNPSPGTE
jgi:hypothetical protein